MPRKLESLLLDGPAGKIETLLEEPEDRDPIAAAIVCHPNPIAGGTMHTKVVHRTARALRATGAVVLRFNYRGVNLSEGEFDDGNGEIDDAHVCLDHLLSRYPNLPYTIAGFSFGSRIALKLAVDAPEARKVIAIGYPTIYRDRDYIHTIRIPKIFVHSTIDEHGPKPDLEALYASLPQPKELHFIEAADHFFVDQLDAFEAKIRQIGPL
jgi:alpha/beta superfamily hydrolase